MILTLYIDGDSEQSVIAQNNLLSLCERHLGKTFEIRIVDVSADPAIAVKEQIIALPTLQIDAESRHRRLVGDLSLASSIITAMGMVETSKRMLQDSLDSLDRVRTASTRLIDKKAD